MDQAFIPCTVRTLRADLHVDAARTAIHINPANAPPVAGLVTALAAMNGPATPFHLALLTSKYWGSGGVKLTVGFLDSPEQALKDRILSHMNAWQKTANVTFVESSVSPDVRIYRGGSGYWSYLGTDILSIPQGQPTMNLQDFTMNTPDSEFFRVVRHETGHTLGFPHEHMRRDIVSRLDQQKTITYFLRTQGWSPQETVQQVLTPLDESSLIGTPHADVVSIMCYQLPGSITKDGQPIPGGLDIDQSDYDLIAKLYPKAVAPPVPDVGGPITISLSGPLPAGRYSLNLA